MGDAGSPPGSQGSMSEADLKQSTGQEGTSGEPVVMETQQAEDSHSVRSAGSTGESQAGQGRVVAEGEGEGGGLDESQGDGVPDINVEVCSNRDQRSPSPLLTTEPVQDEDLDKMCDRLKGLGDELEMEKLVVRDTPLKDYQGLEKLKGLLTEANTSCADFHQYVSRLALHMSTVRIVLAQLQQIIDRKLVSEGITAWLDGRTKPTNKDEIAEEKGVIAEAAAARAAAARAQVDVIKAVELSSRLEADASDAAADAERAIAQAEAARKAAEEARRAAEEKKIADEQARKKAEEERRRKEEEERRRREEEERRKAELEKMSGSAEEQEELRREQERRDPKNWPKLVFSVEPGAMDVPVGCVIRAMPGALEQEHVQVEPLSQLDGVIKLGDNEELVSHIIRVTPVQEDFKLQLEEPLAVAIPHCASRQATREAVIKIKQEDGQWAELETYDVTFEDIKEYKFVECRLDMFGTFVVVTRFKREQFTVQKRGGKMSPSVDQRICFTFKQGAVKNPANGIFEIQPVELSAVTELKHRHAADCEDLLAASPMVTMTMQARRLLKPYLVTLPVPPGPTVKLKRPGTAAPERFMSASGDKGAPRSRPASAFISLAERKAKALVIKELNAKGQNQLVKSIFPDDYEEQEDAVHLMVRDNSGQWIKTPDVTLSEPKKKDAVMFDYSLLACRVMVLRTKPDTPDAKVEKMASLLDDSLSQRVVQVFLRQHVDDPADVVLQCASIQRAERLQRKLFDDGFESGPPPSQDLIVHEGQVLEVRFRGNVRHVDDVSMKFIFNSFIIPRLEFPVIEIDRFAQKSLDCFRGFAQVYTRGMIQKMVPREEDKDKLGGGGSSSQKKNVPMKMITVEGDLLLCELLISLPKPEPEPPKPIPRAPLTIKAEGVITEEVLRHLATDIGDEWKKLAQCLNIRRMRIQAIMRNNVNGEQEKTIYDMLLTWAKKVPRAMNKVEILCSALAACGRIDLVEDLKDREQDYKKERALASRDTHLKKAFLKVAQDQQVIDDWKGVARNLGLAEAEVDSIETQHAGVRERCYQSLVRWQEMTNEDASLELLAKQLRKGRCKNAADQVLAIA